VEYQVKRFGWMPDIPDHRDFLYAAPTHILRTFPSQMDLEPQCPKEVYDQGQLGSCTANAIAGAIEFDQIKQKQTPATPSRLFIYYNERKMEHTVTIDAGAQIRDGIKSVAKQGACPETMWPYDDKAPEEEGTPCPECKFAQQPSKQCYTEAMKHQIMVYQRLVQDLNTMKGCIASGFPFVYGFTVYSNFPFRTTTGEIPMPGTKDHVIGGHAVLAVGYDDATRMFKFRNSWGKGWAKGGYGFMPYSYLTESNLSDDRWTIRTIE
jgi:C1A family cysteine protease